MPTYEHHRPALTVDVALFCGSGASFRVLLIRRGLEPFEGMWALPGGFVEHGERLEHAARRELLEETGIAWAGPLRQVGTFGDPGRDPRGWTVSVAYAAWVGESAPGPVAGDDAASADWFELSALPALAFDHDEILRCSAAVVPASR